jgi:hypothetical protein
MSEEMTTETTSWYSPDNSEFVTTKGWDSADAAINGYRELEKSMGGRVKLPGEDSTPEERSAFYQKLGAKEKAEEYTRPELPEGKVYDEEVFNEFAAVAAAEGVSDTQFTRMIEKYLGIQEKSAEAKLEAENRESAATVEELQREWAGDYEKNIEISKRAIAELVPEDLREAFSELEIAKNLDNNLVFIKAMHAIGAQMMDDSLVKGETPKPKDDYVPAHINSPEMYRFGEDEESSRARAYFEAKGFKY